jgi:hypothetical protein
MTHPVLLWANAPHVAHLYASSLSLSLSLSRRGPRVRGSIPQSSHWRASLTVGQSWPHCIAPSQSSAPVHYRHTCVCHAWLLALTHPLARARHCRPTAATAPAIGQCRNNAPSLLDSSNEIATTPQPHSSQIRSLSSPNPCHFCL